MIDNIKLIDPTILLADGFDDCLIGLTFRNKELVALYSSEKIIAKLTKDMPEDEAEEFFMYNIENAYMGAKTPEYFWNYYDD